MASPCLGRTAGTSTPTSTPTPTPSLDMECSLNGEARNPRSFEELLRENQLSAGHGSLAVKLKHAAVGS
ncbi:hypothetical protein DAI22_03g124050 [Oryza sativa Japonica Group]|nr:hypothetical protein DAI22_03g124050 [Oryza sativa Japonica Group]